jgi:hypothetical protein
MQQEKERRFLIKDIAIATRIPENDISKILAYPKKFHNFMHNFYNTSKSKVLTRRIIDFFKTNVEYKDYMKELEETIKYDESFLQEEATERIETKNSLLSEITKIITPLDEDDTVMNAIKESVGHVGIHDVNHPNPYPNFLKEIFKGENELYRRFFKFFNN